MRFFLIVLTGLGALFFELAASVRIAPWGISPPLLALWAGFWFWRLELQPRLWLAVLAGFFIDSVHLAPFGSAMALFLLLALLTGFFRFFFSDIQSPLTQTLHLGIIIFVSCLASPFLASFLGYMHGLTTTITLLIFTHTVIIGIFWSILLAAPFFLIFKNYRP